MTDRDGTVGFGGVDIADTITNATEGLLIGVIVSISMLEGILGAGEIVLEKEEGSCDPSFGEVVRECPKLVRSSSE